MCIRDRCCEITRGYLSSRVIELKLSACILYGYSNLTLGNVAAAKRGMEMCIRDRAYMDKNNRFRLNDAGLLVYSHGEYLAGGRKVGTFGYSVKKKQQKKLDKKSDREADRESEMAETVSYTHLDVYKRQSIY